MRTAWLPTMPLHVANWSQVVAEMGLGWADQGKTLRLLSNGWSRGEPGDRPGWASSPAWGAFERLWPMLLEARREHADAYEGKVKRAQAGAAARWHKDAPSNAQASPKQSQTMPTPTPTPTETETKKGRGAPRWKRAPRDFSLLPDVVAYGVSKGLTEADVHDEFEAFMRCDFRTAHTDARATFLNWLLREGKEKRRRGGGQRLTRDEKTAAATAAVRAKYALEEDPDGRGDAGGDVDRRSDLSVVSRRLG